MKNSKDINTGKYNFFIRALLHIFHISLDERYGRKIISKFAKEEINNNLETTILDIAAGEGADLKLINQNVSKQQILKLYGNEAYQPNVVKLKEIGIKVTNVDIEKSRLPFDNNSVDIIIANQILEHCKELFWIFTEMHRILKTNGVIIIGVPNLASIHCRLMLLFGLQPPCIETLGPHLRGFTIKDFKYFIEYGNFFKVEKYRGSGHYSFIPGTSKLFSKLFPKSSLTLLLKVRKIDKDGVFLDCLNEGHFETNYYTGDNKNGFVE